MSQQKCRLSYLNLVEVHHRIHKSPPLAPTLSQMDPLYTPPADLHNIHSDPIYTLVFQVVSFLLAFPPKPYTLSSPLPYLPLVPPTSFFLILSA
jgi:hypothetical protein